MAQITIKFRDDEARTIKAFLCQRYRMNKNTGLETLCKIAIRQEVAAEAQKELDEAERVLAEEQAAEEATG